MKKQLQEFETSLNNLFDCDINPSLAEGAAEGEAEVEFIPQSHKSFDALALTLGGFLGFGEDKKLWQVCDSWRNALVDV